MVSLRKRGAAIRQFILDHVEAHPGDIVAFTAQAFALSPQAVHRHLHTLVEQHCLVAEGATRARRYRLHPLVEWKQTYALASMPAEDLVWQRDIRPLLGAMPDNVVTIWQHSFTEMLNNVIDHSAGHDVNIQLTKTAATTQVVIDDDGEGIFQKIQGALGLEDERHAVVELAKGKLTTDPARHSGEGIFFTSRMVDEFALLSGHVCLSHVQGEDGDWILQPQDRIPGTMVVMKMANHTARTTKSVFARFTQDFGFNKTIVPVRLAQYGDEQLLSRSQAKRLCARIDRFKTVLFDFEGVAMIGQAFADEVFRVFRNSHPEITMKHARAILPVRQMIQRAVHAN